MTTHIVAAVQMNSGDNKSKNVAMATELIEHAVARGAKFVALPELFNCLGDAVRIVEEAETIPGPTSQAMSQLASRLGITLLAGSIAERVADSAKVFNTSLLFSPTGAQLACYRKIHLFDIDIPGQVTFCESDTMLSGSEIVVTESSIGQLGQAICYDLRFPELFRTAVQNGATVFVVPSAFTLATGRDHWEVLLRARAIENQAFVIAPNQFGFLSESITTYGRSMIIDPWGTILASASDGECCIVAEIDEARLAETRTRLPSLTHRKIGPGFGN